MYMDVRLSDSGRKKTGEKRVYEAKFGGDVGDVKRVCVWQRAQRRKRKGEQCVCVLESAQRKTQRGIQQSFRSVYKRTR